MDRRKLLNLIRREVERGQAFLDEGLTLASLAERIDSNRTYVSQALMALGGFNTYIGQCRVAHFDAYRQAHPKATVAQAVKVCGFRSRQSYYNMIKSLEGVSQD